MDCVMRKVIVTNLTTSKGPGRGKVDIPAYFPAFTEVLATAGLESSFVDTAGGATDPTPGRIIVRRFLVFTGDPDLNELVLFTFRSVPDEVSCRNVELAAPRGC